MQVAALYVIAINGWPGDKSTGVQRIAIDAVVTAVDNEGDGDLAFAYLVSSEVLS